MKLHEYQAKAILRKYGVTVQEGEVAFSVKEAVEVARKLNAPLMVVKAQIHAGGRGKGGGVKLAKSIEEVEQLANKILGMQLVTHQTGPEGKLVKKILITKAYDIKKELYLGMIVDRGTSKVTIMASEEGGVEIEKVAQETPEKIIIEHIDPSVGLMPFQAKKVGFALNLNAELVGKFTKFLTGLYKAFIENDCTLAEMNPLVITNDNDIVAIDAKFDLDNNGLFRHKDLLEFRDIDEEDPKEYEASKFDLNYISLNGNIACMVNGAGLAMATMDIIKFYGGEPANFLDVGGSATTEMVTNAFRILLSDTAVKGILINIFGGIMKCDVVANGIVEAARNVKLNLPLVVRLEGTNVELGKSILEKSGLPIISASSMGEAAEKIVRAVNERS